MDENHGGIVIGAAETVLNPRRVTDTWAENPPSDQGIVWDAAGNYGYKHARAGQTW